VGEGSGKVLVRMVLELEDTPGQLLRALEPVSRFGGNIKSIMHDREQKTPMGRLPVTLVFEIPGKQQLGRILGSLRERGIRIIQLGEREAAVRKVVLLIGHIIHTDIRDTIDRLNRINGAMVSDLELAMGGPNRESAATMTISAGSEKTAKKALQALAAICRRKGLLMITSLGDE
jgi:ACT domain-containing protein